MSTDSTAAVDGWMSVEDAMPANGAHHFNHCFNVLICSVGDLEPGIGWHETGTWFVDHVRVDVTHWRELPKGPRP